MRHILTVLFVLAFVTNSNAQSFRTLPSGIKFRVVKNNGSKKKIKVGDYAIFKIRGSVSGIELISSKKMNKGVDQPVNFRVTKPTFRGDVMEVFPYLVDGDSAVIFVPQDTFFRNPANKPKGIKPGEDVFYWVKITQVLTSAEYEAQQAAQRKAIAEQKKFAAQQAKIQEAQRKAAAAAKLQAKKDDAAILAYLKAQNITNYQKTKSGLYYVITNPGNGEKPKLGDEVTANYHGTLLDGKIFDSSIDSAFNHVQPFKFTVGARQVIPAWDEAFGQLLDKGAKGYIIAPSALAYGTQGQGANIPPNSVLRFDVEMIDFAPKKTPQQLANEEDAIFLDYFKNNNITDYKRTPSGLYYVIQNEGFGATPRTGDNVSVNYTGTLLDGSKFDSNVDSAFGHVTPFTFAIGKNQVIRGWDEGVALLSIGSKAKLFIPSGLAYGERGSGGKIGPNSPLIFDVEVLNIAPAPPQPADK